MAGYVAFQPACIPACTAAAAHLHGQDPVQIGGAIRQQGARRVKGRSPAPGAQPLHGRHGDGCRGTDCVTCVRAPTSASSLLPPDTSDLLTFALRRAEEEDEHLERTLEQNKGKMAKKEEKCVLQ